MIIKHQMEGDWKELYPKTLGANVELNNGKTVQQIVDEYEPSVRFGEGYDDTEGKWTIILQDRMFIMAQSVTMSSLIQGKYLRSTVLLPMENVMHYNVNFMITDASGSVEDTTHLYVRQKNEGSFQLSTVGSYSSGDWVDVDVQVIGVLGQ